MALVIYHKDTETPSSTVRDRGSQMGMEHGHKPISQGKMAISYTDGDFDGDLMV